jgi:cell envelope opacity-associated protein A
MDNNTICINIIKAIYKKDYKLPEPKKEVPVSSEILTQYAGVYQVMPGFTITISVKNNDLYAQGTDQDEFVIKAESAAKFYSKIIGAEIEFKKDDSGNVTQLILTQGGQKIPASRI